MNVFDYLFERSKHSGKDFVLSGKDTVSFSELYKDSLTLASYLRESVGEGRNIVLLGPNSRFFITAYLGILKSGNVCVPLNYAIEQQNLDFIMEQTECALVCSPVRMQAQYNFGAGRAVFSEEDLATLLQGPERSLPEGSFDPNRLAEIIFTSGSTGAPKGVMLSHGNLQANTESIVTYLGLGEDDIMCVVLPFFYCYGLSLLHTHLRVGGSLVLNNNFIFLGSVLNDLKKHKCTGFAGVPSHFQVLLKKSQSFKTTEFPDLKYVTQAGGKLHNVFIQDFVASFPEVRFYVMYGQTEATARLSYLPPDMLPKKLGSIGRGIPGVELKVVDAAGNPVPDNTEGQLVARGGNIMLGYYKDEEGTRETLKNGWLQTGDLATRDADGYFYIVGRSKEFIKVRGKRVSPKEIEEVILTVDGVIDCTLKGVEDEIMGEAIEATVVIPNSAEEEAYRERILQQCASALASYKIPSRFTFTDKMNTSLSGKKSIG